MDRIEGFLQTSPQNKDKATPTIEEQIKSYRQKIAELDQRVELNGGRYIPADGKLRKQWEKEIKRFQNN